MQEIDILTILFVMACILFGIFFYGSIIFLLYAICKIGNGPEEKKENEGVEYERYRNNTRAK